MKLKLQIIEYPGKRFFLVYDDIHEENEGLKGVGWTVPDAVEDFREQYNKASFYDDDTPVFCSADDITICRTRICQKG